MVLDIPLLNPYVCSSVSYPFSTTLPAALVMLLTEYLAQSLLGKQSCYSPDYRPYLSNGAVFDFIIVGSGPGGATLANRLTENPNVKVLLIEAGREPSITSDIPSMFLSLQKTPEDWQYETEPSPYSCQGFKGGRCRWPRGKVLGGCSTIDVMIYTRGNKLDYDSWAAQGNEGWDYNSIEPYYKKIERVTNPKVTKEGIYGTAGALFSDIYDSSEPIVNLTKQAGLELGYKTFDTQPLTGYFESLSSIKDGVRYTSAKALLSPIKDRKNLSVLLNSVVTKIIINAATNTAEGVELITGGSKFIVKASKEVIVSAGAINSPQLLMLSGIGPKEHLTELGIPVIKDLQVGKNLQDHIMFLGLSANISPNITKLKDLSKEGVNFLTKRAGSFSYTNILNFMMFLNVWNTSEYADIMMKHVMFDKLDFLSYNFAANAFDLNDEFTAQELAYLSQTAVLKFLPALLNTKSRGEIKLRSKDPFDKPLIYSGYFTDPENRDIETMYRAIEYLRSLLKTKAYGAFDIKFLKPAISGCDKFQFDTKEYWTCALRHATGTMFDQGGTCKMGPASDPTAVVSPQLKVHGINKLRIVDGSIMPELPRCFTFPAVGVVGEKAADMIKVEYNI